MGQKRARAWILSELPWESARTGREHRSLVPLPAAPSQDRLRPPVPPPRAPQQVPSLPGSGSSLLPVSDPPSSGTPGSQVHPAVDLDPLKPKSRFLAARLRPRGRAPNSPMPSGSRVPGEEDAGGIPASPRGPMVALSPRVRHNDLKEQPVPLFSPLAGAKPRPVCLRQCGCGLQQRGASSPFPESLQRPASLTCPGRAHAEPYN